MDNKTPLMVFSFDAFASAHCGCFYNADLERQDYPTVNNGYNCRHPKQDDGEDMEDGRFIGACHVRSCQLGYPPNAKDLAEYGVITDDEAEAYYDEDSDEYETMDDYIVVTDEATLQRLLDEGVRPLNAELYPEN